ncbi:MAG: 2-oxoacid:acceptor oxidoreductase subunit alpha, partial [Phycisphaerae bacterium]|nr:2-oxoacid:acceptor oxidoreductase subunit alpha [candidate division KSB1 bacterium]NIV00776.1 2-oxoacid:acceptor oxidoreductase subunit alpha [Phycisphaerae bacterium]NIS24399.1 2-oxoacid:acceptor oxidoreductase subunit alpha [candidate division KSB1 bacterium]NIT71334.1 2-oxoacid:acceptor oxidoreductase subunit alpha [candidate division KSB1 bacterium]NIU25014.1 2-oxoacid:acceptor oxidoreductase subunit alpha [candidate division KSB1 bacterium]
MIKAPASSFTKESLKDLSLDMKTIDRSKNMFALGVVSYLFNRPLKDFFDLIEKKFAKKPGLIEANKIALKTG